MTQADIADYATWTEPETAFQVRYSLALFHQIDMAASDGYRRIPHGGIEVGGLLFGRRFPEGVRVEAFRLIECEHAQGPSFKLSERDVAGLREQIAESGSDPELGELEALGWFIAHTRGPLQLTEAEARLFDDLFPHPGSTTILVKPEKFKPTLFAFLVRADTGTVQLNGADRAIILPLPGRPTSAPETPVMAPEARPRVRIEAPPPPIEAPPPPAPKEPEPERKREAVPVVVEEPAVVREVPAPQPVQAPPTPVAAAPSVPEPAKVTPPPFEWQFDRTPPVEQPLFSGGRTIRREEPRGPRKGMVFAIFLIAALLGGSGAYWLYQQMPPGIIQLTVEPQPTGVTVSWPPDQTNDVPHAYVRVNDGAAVELPPDAKAAGRWQVQADPDNLKVEIIAQHYLRDSRGIVRYVQAASGP